MENATQLGLPWRMLKEKLVTLDQDTQKINYNTTFENIGNHKINVLLCTLFKQYVNKFLLQSVQGASTVVETLYRNKSSLEAIFRIIDKDNSGGTIAILLGRNPTRFLVAGFISLDEFSDACNLIKEHMPSPMTQEQLVEICRLMDINKDGLVDLNEFLETFRLVDPESRQVNAVKEDDSVPNCTHAEINTTQVQLVPVITEERADSNNSFSKSNNNLTEPAESSNNKLPINCNNLNDSLSSHKNVLTQSPVLSNRRGN